MLSANTETYRVSPGSRWLGGLLLAVTLSVTALDRYNNALPLFHGHTGAALLDWQRRLPLNAYTPRRVRGPLQQAMSRWLRAGNSRVVIGRDGWLYDRLGVEYVCGPPVPQDLRPDAALGALVSLTDKLRACGLPLLVVMVPDKATIYPEGLAPNWPATAGPARNVGELRFWDRARSLGVNVLDPTDVVWAAKATGAEPLYARCDQHWDPAGLLLMAGLIADELRRLGWLDGAPGVNWVEGPPAKAAASDDMRSQLGLSHIKGWPEGDPLVLRPVVDAAGQPFSTQPNSPLALIGDSYSTAFFTADLPAQLARLLHVAVDKVKPEELLNSPERRAGCRAVVFEFAAHRLTRAEEHWWHPYPDAATGDR
jgi:hypothetical protein